MEVSIVFLTFILPIALTVLVSVAYNKYRFRDGSSFTVVLNNEITDELKVIDELDFLLVYMNKKEVNPTNIVALIREINPKIQSVKVETNLTYNIRINYKATIANFNEIADSFLPKIKKIIESENLRCINNQKLIEKFKR